MPTNILMPALSPTMTEGTLARWLKAEGDAIRAGDVIAEIETDKATMEVEAVDEGVLGKILVPDGTQNVKVNDPIGVLVADGESAGAAPVQEAARQEPVQQEAGEVASAIQTKAAPAPASVTAVAANGHDTEDRVFASPLAKRMAKQAGIDLASVTGSGPKGRIVRADIDRMQAGTAPAPPVAAAPAPVAAASAGPRPAAPRDYRAASGSAVQQHPQDHGAAVDRSQADHSTFLCQHRCGAGCAAGTACPIECEIA